MLMMLFVKFPAIQEKNLLVRTHNIIRHPDNPRKLYTKMWKRSEY